MNIKEKNKKKLQIKKLEGCEINPKLLAQALTQSSKMKHNSIQDR